MCSCQKNGEIRASDNDAYNQITVTHSNGSTIKEYRNKGRIYMVEVIPKHGKSYFIYPDQLNQQNTLNQDLYDAAGKGVNWTIKEF